MHGQHNAPGHDGQWNQSTQALTGSPWWLLWGGQSGVQEPGDPGQIQ